MSEFNRALILEHWDAANARDWVRFEHLLHLEMMYEVPQTREYIEGAAGYLEMFSTWPGEWRASIIELVCEPTKAVCVIDFITSTETMTGISIFEIYEGKIVKVTDYWPEAYDPPQRAIKAFKRRAE